MNNIPLHVNLSINFRTVTRIGTLLFEVAPPGQQLREYEWTKKVNFGLDPKECGDLLTMDNKVGLEFFHDPNLGTNDQGRITKQMKWTPTPDGRG